MKIFYNPKTFKIMGGSDGDITMDFPYIEEKENYHSFKNLSLKKMKNDKVKLNIDKATFEKGEVKEIMEENKKNGKIIRLRQKMEIDELKKEIAILKQLIK